MNKKLNEFESKHNNEWEIECISYFHSLFPQSKCFLKFWYFVITMLSVDDFHFQSFSHILYNFP